MYKVILFLILIYFIASWFHWLKWIVFFYIICRLMDWHPLGWLTEKDKEEFFFILREEKKEIFIGLISLFFMILSFLLEIFGYIYVYLIIPFCKQSYQELKNFIYRLKNISIVQLFVLYLIPLILLGASLWYRQDESWEVALKRISPELEEFLKFSFFSVVVGLLCFFLFYDNTKNNVSHKVYFTLYGSPKPNRKDHWFLRVCYWLHPDTYGVAKILNLVFLYLFFVYGTFYFYLGFYTFKGVYF